MEREEKTQFLQYSKKLFGFLTVNKSAASCDLLPVIHPENCNMALMLEGSVKFKIYLCVSGRRSLSQVCYYTSIKIL